VISVETNRLKQIAQKIKETAYWDAYYTIGYSTMNGVGNGLAAGDKPFSHAFGEAFVNNTGLGAAINLVYPLAHSKLKESKHYRLYANMFNVAVGAGFLAWHYHMGTEHPLQAVLPSIAVGTAMTNRQVTETQNLEQKVSEQYQPNTQSI
jgi:hypothetical protein